ncbi:EAL domain-containing protein [Paenibacillus sp. PvR148]
MDVSPKTPRYSGKTWSSITKAIIHMAQELDMKIVAEGVENKSQLSFLKQHDCDQIQGYLFSPPVSADEFLKLLSKQRLRPSNSQNERENFLENRREYNRINLYFPLSAEMTLVKIKDKDVDLGMSEILHEDIGLGGLCFLSNIKLPVNPEIILEIQTELLSQTVRVCGNIVWKKEIDEEIFQYGLRYKVNEKERDELAQILNELSIQLRKTPLVPNCRFIKMDRISYIKSIKEKLT